MTALATETPKFRDASSIGTIGRGRDLRLPDAVTVRYGPVQLLSKLFLTADQEVRNRGVRLRVRRDMDALLELNKQETERGNWYPLLPMFNTEMSDLTAEDAYWISGVNDAGETVVAQAGRIYQWHDTNLAREFRSMMYPDPACRLPVSIECDAASLVRGVVCYSGSTWFRPDYRRIGLSRMLPRISRAYAAATWGTDWTVSFIQRQHVEQQIPQAYGYTDLKFGFRLPGSPWGDLELTLVRMNSLELVADIERFMAERAKAA